MSAADFKAKGNEFLQSKKFDEAIAAYTKAIELDSSDHVFFSNRSAAYLSKGDATHALQDGEKCVQMAPQWAKGYSRKGAALHALKRYDDAIATYQAGLAIAPNDAGLKSGLEEVQKAKNAPPRGMGGIPPALLTKLAAHPKFGPKLADPAFMAKLNMLQTNPQLMLQDPEIMELFGVLTGQAEEAPEPTPSPAPTPKKDTPPPRAPSPEPATPEEAALREKKKAALAAKERGNALYKSKQFAEALAAYDEAIAHDPTNAMFINNKAAVYIEMNDYDAALSLCNSAIEVGRANRAPYEDIAKIYGRMATAYVKMDRIHDAIAAYSKGQTEHFDKAVERKIKNLELELREKERKAYINPELGAEAKEKGNQAFRDGRFPEAVSHYEEAIKRDPTNAAYYNNLAATLQKLGDFGNAKRNVEKAIELDKNYWKAWAKKGDIEFFMKEYHKAMESYKMGLQIEPDNSLCKQGLNKTIAQINAGGMDAERQAHAMADPEIQMILQDPMIRQVLQDMQENPMHGQRAMADPDVRKKIEKLIAAGVLQVK